jgi:hypothetical protein
LQPLTEPILVAVGVEGAQEGAREFKKCGMLRKYGCFLGTKGPAFEMTCLI